MVGGFHGGDVAFMTAAAVVVDRIGRREPRTRAEAASVGRKRAVKGNGLSPENAKTGFPNRNKRDRLRPNGFVERVGNVVKICVVKI